MYIIGCTYYIIMHVCYIYLVKLNGRTYHFIPRSNNFGGLHHFILDNYNSALAHGATLSTTLDNTKIDGLLKESIIELFWFVLDRDNCHVQSCKLLGKAFSAVNEQNFPEDDYEPAQVAFPPNVIAEINECGEAPHALDIAAVTDDTIIGNRVIRFKLKNTNTWKQIPVTHPDIEPLSYPLLFLEGEQGWGDNVAKAVPFCSYIVSRMLMPEENCSVRNAANTKWISANRFQIFARLSQYWLCDSVSRSIDRR